MLTWYVCNSHQLHIILCWNLYSFFVRKFICSYHCKAAPTIQTKKNARNDLIFLNALETKYSINKVLNLEVLRRYLILYKSRRYFTRVLEKKGKSNRNNNRLQRSDLGAFLIKLKTWLKDENLTILDYPHITPFVNQTKRFNKRPHHQTVKTPQLKDILKLIEHMKWPSKI